MATPIVVPETDKSGIQNGRWKVFASIRLPDKRGWRVTPVLKFAAESGSGAAVKWTLEALEGCKVEGDGLKIPAGTRKVRFVGTSIPESHPIPAEDSAVTVVLRNVEPLAEGDAA